MFIREGHSVSSVLKYVGVKSSTWYKAQKEKTHDQRVFNKGRPIPGYTKNPDGTLIPDASIVKALEELRAEKFLKRGGGYKKLCHYLRRKFNFHINSKKVYRLCSEHDLLLPRKKKNKRRGRIQTSEKPNVTGPNQLWQFDIKYGLIRGENRFFFLMVFIDVFNREIKDYHIGLKCKASDIVFTLDNAIKKHKIDPEGLTVRSDNGPQMTSKEFKNYISGQGLEHEFIPPSSPNLNAYVESFFSIVETELFQTKDFEYYSEAYTWTVEFIKFYNEERIHGSLKMKPPKEFLNDWTKENELRHKIVSN